MSLKLKAALRECRIVINNYENPPSGWVAGNPQRAKAMRKVGRAVRIAGGENARAYRMIFNKPRGRGHPPHSQEFVQLVAQVMAILRPVSRSDEQAASWASRLLPITALAALAIWKSYKKPRAPDLKPITAAFDRMARLPQPGK